MSGQPSILDLVEAHDRRRQGGLNLVASETWVSPDVRRALGSDLAGRYHSDWYGGSEHAEEILERTEALAREAFHCRHAIVTSLSGNLCDLALILAATEPGGKVAMAPRSHGGYPLAAEKLHRHRLDIPMEGDLPLVDAEGTLALLRTERPGLTLLGSSFIPFPHPVEAVAEGAATVNGAGADDAWVCYDGAHVLGLIATGAFQDPLGEGARALIGSTHKSFPGPQGGLVLTNDDDVDAAVRGLLDFDFEAGIGLVDNPHPHRVAALGVALEELKARPDYGGRVVENAKALARALDEHGLPVRFRDLGYTESHQVILDLEPEEGKRLCADLADVGVFVDIGGRLGAAEAAWRGLNEADMEDAASVVAEVYEEGPTKGAAEAARAVAARQRNE